MPSDVASLWTAPLVMRKTDNRVSVLAEHNRPGPGFWQPFSPLGTSDHTVSLSLTTTKQDRAQTPVRGLLSPVYLGGFVSAEQCSLCTDLGINFLFTKTFHK